MSVARPKFAVVHGDGFDQQISSLGEVDDGTDLMPSKFDHGEIALELGHLRR